MNKKRVIFLGTPEFAQAHLEFLIGSSKYEVCGVVTQPDRPSGRGKKLKQSAVKELALSAGLECISPSKLNLEHFEQIKSWNAEAAVVVAFGQILSQEFLNLYPDKVVNVHGSLLPRWRGAAPIQRAIMAGDEKTGVCLQIMVKALDAGDVIGEREIMIRPDMSALELHDHLKVLGTDLLDIEFHQLLEGTAVRKPQNEELVNYASKLDKAESLINWELPAIQVLRNLKGLSLGPGVFSFYQDKKIKIKEAQVNLEFTGRAGAVVHVTKDRLVVACGENALEVLEVQPESKSKMSVQSFLQGNPIKEGEVLGE